MAVNSDHSLSSAMGEVVSCDGSLFGVVGEVSDGSSFGGTDGIVRSDGSLFGATDDVVSSAGSWFAWTGAAAGFDGSAFGATDMDVSSVGRGRGKVSATVPAMSLRGADYRQYQ